MPDAISASQALSRSLTGARIETALEELTDE